MAAPLTREQVLAWLDVVKDPEIPVLSVVELGVVRDVIIGDESVIVEITPTYSGCPAMHVMEDEIRAALGAHGIIAQVRLVFREPWTTAWMSDASREKLRAYGIAPPEPEAIAAPGLVALRRQHTVACPHCGSPRTVLKSEFGSTACKSIHVCSDCRQPFDHFKAI
ncbi:MAG: phenylacetate-CoA oxygenase subunit PaaJ [Gemmatimonadaceae bacterium]|nr:phenylacetate-CoA oxygenase subunit PaaJ [Gemmatimonadaceae bacterium]